MGSTILLGTQGVNALVISLKKTEDTDRFAAWLEDQFYSLDLEIKTWVELNDFYEKTVELYKGQFGVLQLIILVMVLLSVANSVNMSIFERTGEFGTMMALPLGSSLVLRHHFSVLLTTRLTVAYYTPNSSVMAFIIRAIELKLS